MGNSNKVLKGVRVLQVSNVPALYFFRPKVRKAIENEINKDLKRGGKVRVPAGCQGIYGPAPRYSKAWGYVKAKALKFWNWVKW